MRRTGFGLALAMGLTAAGTTWVATTSWSGFTAEPDRYLMPLLWLALTVAGSGALARWVRLPRPLVVPLQVLATLPVVSLTLTGKPLPLGDGWVELRSAIDLAVESANRYAPPVPADAPGVHPLLVLGGWGCLLLVDLLACTLRRVPLAGLPLLAVYSVPVGLLGGALGWWGFALTAAGFLLLLYLHESDEVNRWGRGLDGEGVAPDAASFGVRTGAVRASAGTIGGAATALAVVVPAFVPTFGIHVFDLGRGDGGDSEITIENPMTDLVRDLIRGENVPLMQVRTNDPRPDYLRIGVLNHFSGEEWTSGDRQVPDDQVAEGQMPALDGVDPSVPRTLYSYQVQVTDDFESTWLPTQAPISRIRAEGDWRYDEATMDFLAADEDLTTAGAAYSMTAVELDLSSEALASAPSPAGEIGPEFTALPQALPPVVRNLAAEVTRDAPTRFEKAVALQQWFREDGGFEYDVRSAPGNGSNALVEFLSDDEEGRIGYCEQFSSAMAVMARVVGIPARVAVGFLEPARIGPGLWEYSAHDMHAWPELYFPGSGWVRFEPTPPGRAEDTPSYTTQTLPGVDPTTGPTNLPSAGNPRDDEVASRGPEETPESAAVVDDESEFPWGPTAGAAVVVVLGALALLLPRARRSRLRQRRLHGSPEEAWAELRATATDLRLPWPEGRSPRATRAWLVTMLGRPVDDLTPARPARGPDQAPDAVLALDRIVSALERLRYARAVEPHVGALSAEVTTCVAALEGGATQHARRLATWWPRSVLNWSALAVRRQPPTPMETRYGGVVDRVG
ncbi:transglutaminaseTgpA domain-containing protein [Nocardioides ferulae]|uniref:transglutaminase family protein n=1 Tax=Nocardioides ferulae TaxID=2340821 RepID=UPI000EB4D5A7|nr:DUF3488 and transglutaminase-like domain-containing protein [Nocardioides ferulae]